MRRCFQKSWEGFQDCLQASKFLEQALGVVAQESKTAEFHQAAAAEQHVRQ